MRLRPRVSGGNTPDALQMGDSGSFLGIRPILTAPHSAPSTNLQRTHCGADATCPAVAMGGGLGRAICSFRGKMKRRQQVNDAGCLWSAATTEGAEELLPSWWPRHAVGH